MTIYSSHDTINLPLANHQQKFYTHFPGFYFENFNDGATAVNVVLGCKTYYSITAGGPAANDLYGQCMEGWLHTMRVQTFAARTQQADVTVRNKHHASSAAG